MNPCQFLLFSFFVVGLVLLVLHSSCTQEAILTTGEHQIMNVTDIDGNVYKTVKIGNQIWMKENLRVKQLNDGTPIHLVTDSQEWSNTTTYAYTWYEHNEQVYGADYGNLYNFYTVETGKLCPQGWHVPDKTEWKILIDYLGGTEVAGGKLKEAGTAHWDSPNEGATDASGFSALPGGHIRSIGLFFCNTHSAVIWSSEEHTQNNTAWYFTLSHIHECAYIYDMSKASGLSIRCLKKI